MHKPELYFALENAALISLNDVAGGWSKFATLCGAFRLPLVIIKALRSIVVISGNGGGRSLGSSVGRRLVANTGQLSHSIPSREGIAAQAESTDLQSAEPAFRHGDAGSLWPIAQMRTKQVSGAKRPYTRLALWRAECCDANAEGAGIRLRCNIGVAHWH